MDTESTALEEITTEVKLQRAMAVVEHQVKHGTSVEAACRACGVSRTSFYRWVGEGVLTDYLAECRNSRMRTVQAMAAEALPDVMQHMIRLATGQESVRGASPIAAAEFVAKAGGLRVGGEKEGHRQTNIVFLPQMETFHVAEGGLVRNDEGQIEIIEGEVEELPPGDE